MAKHYSEKPIEKWTVRDLTDYMSDEHVRRFGCDYAPFGGWAAERGRIGQWFGTAKKAGKYDKALVKEFVDYCFETYSPNAKYPGISFGFMATYKTAEFQAIQKRYEQRKLDEKKAEEITQDKSSISDWLNS